MLAMDDSSVSNNASTSVAGNTAGDSQTLDSKKLTTKELTLAQLKKQQDIKPPFQLDGKQEPPEFQLESPVAEPSPQAKQPSQSELFLPEVNPEQAPDESQLEFDGLAKPIHALQVEGIQKPLEFHYANNLLESLEAQDVQVPYQCREGYCGGCRTDLIEGEVAYLQEPMAWINEGEILPCCCVPKTALKLKLKG